jgi:hypothetical protein
MKPITPREPVWTKDVKYKLITYAKNQPQYEPLPAYVEDSPMGTAITEWEPTSEERRLIINGANIRISVLTFKQPLQPLKVEVT